MAPEQDMSFCGEPNCEEYWMECAVCGCEFCSKCFPNSTLCPDCADMAEVDEEEEEPDFEDVPNVKALIEDETETDEALDQEERIP